MKDTLHGFIISFVVKSEKWKNVGQTIFAFGLLFLGIETMGSVMKPLASSPIFLELIGKVADIPVLGVAVGTLMTAPFSQVLHAIDQIGNSCVNITETVSSQIDFQYFMIENNR